MNILGALLSGSIFGLGLVVAGMANPAKVLGFLDLAGDWDPSLALVMVGAIAVGAVAFAIARRRTRSLSGSPMQLPTARRIDLRLIGGSALFGVGWGLAGICPGPALVLIGAGAAKGWIFLGAMLAGMLLFQVLERRSAALPAAAAAGGRSD
ncbi:MAG TPA: YeeE/YedE thiosulfate transporter family protein [Burkholderiales bacterium]|nr:YeeE/YedE thiosulfate transporter family protein [Burkholderiales bacterium]